MQQHKKPRGGGFTGFLRRLFSSRARSDGSAASTAEPLPVDSGPSRPKRKGGPAHK